MNLFQIRLKELRKEAKITQQELAESLTISKQTVSNYESGSREPSIDILSSISSHFNVSVDYLIGVSEIKNHGLTLANNKLNGLNEFMELFSEVEFIKQNIIDILNDFLDLVLRHTANTEILRDYADILKLLNLHDSFLIEAYSSSKILEGVDVVRYSDGLTVSSKQNSEIRKKELDTAYEIAKKLSAIDGDYLDEKVSMIYHASTQPK